MRLTRRAFGAIAAAPAIAGLSTAGASLAPMAPLPLGKHRELFVDGYVIDRLQGVRQVPHEPRDMGAVYRFDKPWEGPFSAYVSVLKDGGVYRMYYRGLPRPEHDTGYESLCYAESADGVNWTRPDLGLVAVDGSTRNNVLIGKSEAGTHAFGPFLDHRPGVRSDQRYKALGLMRWKSPNGKPDWALAGWTSPDGVRWTRTGEKPLIVNDTPHFAFDSQNVCFWSESEGVYVAYGRTWKDGVRRISRWTSPNFETWSGSSLMEYRRGGAPAPIEHLYTNQTHPYFRAPQIYLSTAARFFPGRQVLSAEEAKAIRVDADYFKDTSDSVLMSSRGGSEYDRTFMGALIKPGIGAQNWVSRSNYPALNIVQTGADEMSIYVNQNYGQPTSHLRRYAWRLDGLASLQADYEGGEWVSKTLEFIGKELSLNFATSAGGSIRVEFQDSEGAVLPGYALADCREVIGNEIDRRVRWRSESDVSALAGRPVRIRMRMKDADLYSFRFEG